ncbi:hypothetical protein SAMN05518801_1376 [Novosphingobium sp. CF614]|uniref:hypothetical protein n=1 Tax=Novosphingobium sp. CF614 TaxID=1884364 RepID=UPI0008E8FF54|nr:hypothetical protein [Novosphingobium sp. CF614]SFG50708.1 hypothetical protein SAMN05518801_1376 [Novosphingobium sp. CF614]
MTVQLHSHFAEAAKPALPPRRKPPRPISVRVTHQERAELEREAGEKTLSAYVRSVLFDTPGRRRKHSKPPDIDRVALARVLALLGHLGIAPDLKVIAESARRGTLECSPELLIELEQACRNIMLMRADLIRALGIKAE